MFFLSWSSWSEHAQIHNVLAAWTLSALRHRLAVAVSWHRCRECLPILSGHQEYSFNSRYSILCYYTFGFHIAALSFCLLCAKGQDWWLWSHWSCCFLFLNRYSCYLPIVSFISLYFIILCHNCSIFFKIQNPSKWHSGYFSNFPYVKKKINTLFFEIWYIKL